MPHTPGWWRQNRIALPAMVVALVALAWPVSETARDQWLSGEPRVAHQPGADGWATIEHRSLRLASLTPVTDLPEQTTAEPADLAGYKIWRTEIESRADGDATICQAELLDASGHTYDGASAYVPSFDDETHGVECGDGDEPVSVEYFLLPDDAEPVAVRVVHDTLDPDYWRLPAD